MRQIETCKNSPSPANLFFRSVPTTFLWLSPSQLSTMTSSHLPSQNYLRPHSQLKTSLPASQRHRSHQENTLNSCIKPGGPPASAQSCSSRPSEPRREAVSPLRPSSRSVCAAHPVLWSRDVLAAMLMPLASPATTESVLEPGVASLGAVS